MALGKKRKLKVNRGFFELKSERKSTKNKNQRRQEEEEEKTRPEPEPPMMPKMAPPFLPKKGSFQDGGDNIGN